MERSDAVTVILARITKMMALASGSLGRRSLEDSRRLGEPIPIPLRARHTFEAPTQGRITIDRDEHLAVARFCGGDSWSFGGFAAAAGQRRRDP